MVPASQVWRFDAFCFLLYCYMYVLDCWSDKTSYWIHQFALWRIFTLFTWIAEFVPLIECFKCCCFLLFPTCCSCSLYWSRWLFLMCLSLALELVKVMKHWKHCRLSCWSASQWDDKLLTPAKPVYSDYREMRLQQLQLSPQPHIMYEHAHKYHLTGLQGDGHGLRLDLRRGGSHLTPNNDLLYLQHFHAGAFRHDPGHMEL